MLALTVSNGCTGFDRVTNKILDVLAVMSSGESDGEKCEEVVMKLPSASLVGNLGMVSLG
jgi:hypothetical protein